VKAAEAGGRWPCSTGSWAAVLDGLVGPARPSPIKPSWCCAWAAGLARGPARHDMVNFPMPCGAVQPI
jgi:hypothetical protein